jgi:sulfoxide reductase heme-binding subunit YedZ
MTQLEDLLHNQSLLWYLNRGTGVVLLALLTASVSLGVLSTLRTTSRWWPRFVTQALHRNLSLLAVVLLLTHAGAAIVDSYVDLTWLDAVVPFIAGYQPLWVALGTIALDLTVLVTATSLARHRFSSRRWRAVHLSSYLAWLLGVIHGIGIGTDRRTPWSIAVTGTCMGVVAGAGALRLMTANHERRLAKVTG